MRLKTYLSILIIITTLISTDIYGQFITTWDPGTDNQITIPTAVGGIYNYDVDWGDGSTDTGVTGSQTHTYASAGIYTVTITGAFPSIYFNDINSNKSNSDKILTIEQWGNIAWDSFFRAFLGCSNLDINATDSPDLSNVTDMGLMFRGCNNLKGGVSNWNVSNVTNMGSMFSSATSFSGNISNWNVSNVTDMQEMFYFARSFNQDLNLWDVSNVTNMGYMFSNATSFNGNIANWNVSKTIYMNSMFWDATSFNQDLNLWEVSNVTRMNSMFSNATSFNGNIANWNVSLVDNMAGMFYGATSFNGIISNWKVSNVTDMNSMYYGAPSFNQDLNLWDVSNVTNMGYMFYNATSFNGNIANWNVSKVTDTNSMFSLATSFNQDLNLWDVSNVTNMIYMFKSAPSFNQNLNLWDVSLVESMRGMFSNAISFNGNISNWNVSQVNTMTEMFKVATSFNGNIANWNVSSVISFSGFLTNSGLSSINYDALLSSWSLLNLQDGLTFDADGIHFSFGSMPARQKIIDDNGWIINDGGLSLASSNTISVEENIVGEILDLNAYAGNGTPTDAGVSYSLTSTNDNGLFTITSSDGKLEFKTPPNFEDPSDQNNDNEYELLVTLNDDNGLYSSSHNVRVTVTNINETPIQLSTTTDDQLVEEGFNELTIDFSSSFEDPDGDELVLTAVSSDESVVTATISTGFSLVISETGIGSSTITVIADDGNGGSIEESFIFTVTAFVTGLATTKENAISVYPNPSASTITLESASKNGQVRLYDLDGQLQLKEKATTKQQIDISWLPSGIYLLVVEIYGKKTTTRIRKTSK